MKISVIIPTLNEEEALPKLLLSLSKQTYSPDEVIIVDGKSDDETVKRAREFAHQFTSFRIIRSDKRNLPHQRNLGGKNASGDWLVFVDADTVFPKSFFLDLHKKMFHARWDAFTVYCLPDEVSFRTRIHAFLWNVSLLLQNMTRSVVLMGSFAAIKSSVFTKSHGYDETYSFSEDMEYSFRLKKEGYAIIATSSVRAYLSQRRFRTFGYFRTFLIYAYPWAYMLVTGGKVPSSHPQFQMGGQVFRKSHPSVL